MQLELPRASHINEELELEQPEQVDEEEENLQLVKSRMADLEKHKDDSDNACAFVIRSVTPGKVVAE